MGLSDEALMAAYVQGDKVAFRTLFERYVQPLSRMMGRGLFSQRDTRDLVQKTFLQLHRARYDFREGSSLRPWLFTIAMNVKRQYLRTVKRRRENDLAPEERQEPTVSAYDPVRSEQVRQLRTALTKLPVGQREVIELHWLEGLSFQEVATVVGATRSAVKVRAHRGYARLEEILRTMGVTEQFDAR